MAARETNGRPVRSTAVVKDQRHVSRQDAVCDICEKRKPEGKATHLVTRLGADLWLCHGCMMQAVTKKKRKMPYMRQY